MHLHVIMRLWFFLPIRFLTVSVALCSLFLSQCEYERFRYPVSQQESQSDDQSLTELPSNDDFASIDANTSTQQIPDQPSQIPKKNTEPQRPVNQDEQESDELAITPDDEKPKEKTTDTVDENLGKENLNPDAPIVIPDTATNTGKIPDTKKKKTKKPDITENKNDVPVKEINEDKPVQESRPEDDVKILDPVKEEPDNDKPFQDELPKEQVEDIEIEEPVLENVNEESKKGESVLEQFMDWISPDENSEETTTEESPEENVEIEEPETAVVGEDQNETELEDAPDSNPPSASCGIGQRPNDQGECEYVIESCPPDFVAIGNDCVPDPQCLFNNSHAQTGAEAESISFAPFVDDGTEMILEVVEDFTDSMAGVDFGAPKVDGKWYPTHDAEKSDCTITYGMTPPGLETPLESLQHKLVHIDCKKTADTSTWANIGTNVEYNQNWQDADGIRIILGMGLSASQYLDAQVFIDSVKYSQLIEPREYDSGKITKRILPFELFKNQSGEVLRKEQIANITEFKMTTTVNDNSIYIDQIELYKIHSYQGYLTVQTNHPANNTFEPGEQVELTFTLKDRHKLPDGTTGFLYSIFNYDNVPVVERKPVSFTTASDYTEIFRPTEPGYYEIRAYFMKQDESAADRISALKTTGSIPSGMATFGVVPQTVEQTVALRKSVGEDAFFGLMNHSNGLEDTLGTAWNLQLLDWNYIECKSMNINDCSAKPTAERIAQNWNIWKNKRDLEHGVIQNYDHEIINVIANADWRSPTPTWAQGSIETAPPFANWNNFTDFFSSVVNMQKSRYPHTLSRIYDVMAEVDLNDVNSPVRIPSRFTNYTAKDVVDTYRHSKEIINEQDQNAKLIGPNYHIYHCRGFFDEAVREGLLDHVDGISVHAYHHGSPENAQLVEKTRLLKKFLKEKNNGEDLPIFDTESGYLSHYGSIVRTKEQAEWMARKLIILKAEGYQKVFPYYVSDQGLNQTWGLTFNLDPDWINAPYKRQNISPKPSLMAYATTIKMLEGYTPTRELRRLGGHENVWGYQFEKNDEVVMALWNPETEQNIAVDFDGDYSVRTVNLMGAEKVKSTSNKKLSVKIGTSPVFIKYQKNTDLTPPQDLPQEEVPVTSIPSTDDVPVHETINKPANPCQDVVCRVAIPNCAPGYTAIRSQAEGECCPKYECVANPDEQTESQDDEPPITKPGIDPPKNIEIDPEIETEINDRIDDPFGLKREAVEIGRLSPGAYPITSQSGRYVYIPTGKWIDVLDLQGEKIPDASSIPNYTNSAVIKRIHFPENYHGFTKMAYENKNGRDYLYTGWDGQNGEPGGHIARIDLTDPLQPQIKISTGNTPTHLVGAKAMKLVIVGDKIVGHYSSTKMSSGTWTFPQYINVWDKNSLVFKGAIATNDGKLHQNTDLAPDDYNIYSANFVTNPSPTWLWGFENTLSEISPLDGHRILYINQNHSFVILDLDKINWSQPPLERCVVDINRSPANCQGSTTSLYIQYPEYQCYLDNFVDKAKTNAKYLLYPNFGNAVQEASCSNLYKKQTGIEKRLFENNQVDWSAYINPIALALPTGKKMAVLTGGMGDNHMVLMDLDPVFQTTAPKAPKIIKVVDIERYQYLSSYSVTPDTICGDWRHYGGNWSDIQCWKIKHDPKVATNKNDDEFALFPLGALNTPWNIHVEKIFSPYLSSNKKYAVGGDKNVIVFDLEKSFFSQSCQDWAETYGESLMQPYNAETLLKHEYSLYPSGSLNGQSAIYNSPCSKFYKSHENPSLPQTTENLGEHVSLYFPSYTTWPFDYPMQPATGQYALMAEWLTGAKLWYRDTNNDFQYKQVNYYNPLAATMGQAFTNYDGSRIYFFTAWNNRVEEHTVQYDATSSTPPDVNFLKFHETAASINGPSGGIYDDHNNNKRYAILGAHTQPYSPSAARIQIFDLENFGQVQEISYSLKDFISVPPNYITLQMRPGEQIGKYFYAPISVTDGTGKYGKERIYLLTLDMDKALGGTPGAIASVIPVLPQGENDPDNLAGQYLGELMNNLRIDPELRVGIFTTYNASDYKSGPAHGILIDFAAYSSGGYRLPTGVSKTPVVVRSLYRDVLENRPSVTLEHNGKTYNTRFNYNGYLADGCSYYLATDPSVIDRSIMVHKIVVDPEAHISDPYRIDFEPFAVYGDDTLKFDRHLAFVGNRGVSVHESGVFSIPKTCSDD